MNETVSHFRKLGAIQRELEKNAIKSMTEYLVYKKAMELQPNSVENRKLITECVLDQCNLNEKVFHPIFVFCDVMNNPPSVVDDCDLIFDVRYFDGKESVDFRVRVQELIKIYSRILGVQDDEEDSDE